MPLLLTLGLPCLTETVLKIFAEAGIKTVEDLFFTEKLKRCALEENILQRVLRDIELHLGAVMYTVTQLIDSAGGACYPTRLRQFDTLLSGGLHAGQLLELAGTMSSGKTQFCMYTAMLMGASGAGVFYIDSTNSFSSKRVCDMYQANPTITNKSERGLLKLLDSIRTIHVFDAYVLLNVLQQIKARCALSECANDGRMVIQPFDRTVKLLIIDSMNTLLAPILGGTQRLGHALLAEIGRLLKQIAIENEMAIIVTNVIVSKRESESQLFPGLGVYWAGVPSTRINLIQQDRKSVV